MEKPYQPFYWGDYIRDTRHLTLEEHGAYLMLIGEYWNKGGKVYADERRLFRALSCETDSERNAIRIAIAEFFVTNDEGKLVHRRIDADLQKIKERHERRSRAGKKAAQARYSKQNEEGTAEDEVCETHAKRMPIAQQSHSIPSQAKPSVNTPTDVGVVPPPKKSKEEKKCDILLREAVDREGIDPQLFDDFVQMRKKIRAPLTDRAKELVLMKLSKAWQNGHCPNKMLELSVRNSWKDVYEKDETLKIERMNGNGQHNAKPYGTTTGKPTKTQAVAAALRNLTAEAEANDSTSEAE